MINREPKARVRIKRTVKLFEYFFSFFKLDKSIIKTKGKKMATQTLSQKIKSAEKIIKKHQANIRKWKSLKEVEELRAEVEALSSSLKSASQNEYR
jgi:hypothetical protein